jgi:5-methylcytosine-specific restriction endonuclease McrA
MNPSGEGQTRRDRLTAQAGYRCGYCRPSEKLTSTRLILDHLTPRKLGGSDDEDNLWPACPTCNEFKQARIDARDPDTGQVAPLFNPRKQRWNDHFAWIEEGRLIAGLTPTGRATVTALRLNRGLLVEARATWIAFGMHPPAEGAVG